MNIHQNYPVPVGKDYLLPIMNEFGFSLEEEMMVIGFNNDQTIQLEKDMKLYVTGELNQFNVIVNRIPVPIKLLLDQMKERYDVETVIELLDVLKERRMDANQEFFPNFVAPENNGGETPRLEGGKRRIRKTKKNKRTKRRKSMRRRRHD